MLTTKYNTNFLNKFITKSNELNCKEDKEIVKESKIIISLNFYKQFFILIKQEIYQIKC